MKVLIFTVKLTFNDEIECVDTVAHNIAEAIEYHADCSSEGIAGDINETFTTSIEVAYNGLSIDRRDLC